MTFDWLQGRDYGTGMEIRPVTGDDLTDLTRLFDSSGVLSGCWCMFFLLSGKECGAGPRARYGRILRSPLMKGREVAEDATVWVVPCFFVRRDARRTGVTRALLRAAVDLAAEHGATAVEGLPLAAGGRHPSAEAYVGTEDVFAACGFQPTSRPSPRRLVMRRALSPRRRSAQGTGARTGP